MEQTRTYARCHLALKKAETFIQTYRDKLAHLEAPSKPSPPHLQLPHQLLKPNPIFARGKLRHLALDRPRDAGKPPAIREMAIGALWAEGVRRPHWRTDEDHLDQTAGDVAKL